MAIRSTVVAALALLLVATDVLAQPSGNSSANWLTAGPVYAVARSGSTVFLGGSFNAIAPRSQQLGAFGAFLQLPARRVCLLPPIVGSVSAIISDGTSGWYVGGRFDRVGSIERQNLVHISAGCIVDTNWSGIVRGRVNALSLANSVLYVGGSFTQAGQQGGGVVTRNNLAAFSPTGILTTWDPSANGEVFALEAQAFFATTAQVQVYVGGAFTQVGGAARQRLAAVDGAGAVTTFVADADGSVLTLDVDTFGSSVPARVWIGGEFTSVAGAARNRLAMITIATNAVDPSFNPDANAPVRSVVVTGSSLATATIFAGGDFTSIGGATTKNYAAALSPSGIALPFEPNPDGPVFALSVDSTFSASAVFIGGRFTRLGGATRLNAGRVAATTGVAQDWNPAFNGDVRALASANSFGRVAVGGDFDAISAQRRRNLAAVNLDTGELLPFAPDVNGVVRALAVRNRVLYVGGDFTRVDTATRNRLAAFADISRALLDWNPNADGAVSTLQASGTMIYAGGDFLNMGSSARVRLAGIDAVTGAVSSSFAPPDFNGRVAALARDSTYLYVGGAFTSVGGVPTPYLARVDAATGARDLVWLPAPNGEVRALCGFDPVYVGGVFTMVGTSPRSNLAAVDVTTGAATAFQPEPNGAVNALECRDAVFAGGAFTTVGSGSAQQTRPRLAQLSPSASGLTATYATSFRARGIGTVLATMYGVVGVAYPDGLLAAGFDDPIGDEEEPVAHNAFFPNDFVGTPGAPTSPSAVHISSVLRLRWSPPNRGPRPTRYLISAGTSPGAANLASGLPSTATQIDISTMGVPNNAVVYLRIAAVNTAGAGPPSDELQFMLTSVCTTAPDPPTELAATVTAFDVNFNWTPASGENVGSYRFEAGVAPGRSDLTVNTTGASLAATAPTSGVFYARVRSNGTCGTSIPSSEVTLLIGGAAAPPSAPLLGASVGSQRSATISWTPPATGVATAYRLEAGSGFKASDIVTMTTTQTTLTFHPVPPGTYYLRVYALGANGTVSPASDEFIFQMP